MAEWLAYGSTGATSAGTVTLADGEEARVSLFVTGSGAVSIPARAYVNVISDEGGSNAGTVAASVSGSDPECVIRGPGTYYVIRPNLAAEGIGAVGVNSSKALDA